MKLTLSDIPFKGALQHFQVITEFAIGVDCLTNRLPQKFVESVKYEQGYGDFLHTLSAFSLCSSEHTESYTGSDD